MKQRNMFNDMGDIVRLYSQNPKTATIRLANLLSMVSGRSRVGIVEQSELGYIF